MKKSSEKCKYLPGFCGEMGDGRSRWDATAKGIAYSTVEGLWRIGSMDDRQRVGGALLPGVQAGIGLQQGLDGSFAVMTE
jgi:hypothetical protein